MEKIGNGPTLVRLSGQEAKDICRLEQGEKCCAFLVVSHIGFECVRMSYPANSSILTRLIEGSMEAKGTGGWINCAWEGEGLVRQLLEKIYCPFCGAKIIEK
ncbi:MAG: hypothetical protein ACOCP4_04080 [Candidatus Woesearchaeota archaeon]